MNTYSEYKSKLKIGINRRTKQRAVALVITLIMLSVATMMTVAFLIISRRERGAVTVSIDKTQAQLMADAALNRAIGETIAMIRAKSNLLNYGFIVSTNFINPNGFLRGWGTNLNNVNYTYADGRPLSKDDLLVNLCNLFYDPRPPVFPTSNEFRFYLDFNRNAQFESNGLLPVIGPGGQLYTFDASSNMVPTTGNSRIVTNFFVGDPEWIGQLEYPDRPHSPTNRFKGRYAFVVLPMGKSLDLNYVHNHTKISRADMDGFSRNFGLGPWEINLAAFFRDLNTNVWRNYYYNRLGLNQPNTGEAFETAFNLLNYRYNGNYNNLRSIEALFGQTIANWVMTNLFDEYSDGPFDNPFGMPKSDNDRPRNPWPGSDSINQFYDIQQIFSYKLINTNYLTDLLSTNIRNTLTFNDKSSYHKYTFYRLISQLGTDSPSDFKSRININFRNDPPFSETNFVDWPPLVFFTNAADRLLRQQFGDLGISITNIPIYPTNYYSSAVHRLLQLAANIYDSTTNRTVTSYPFVPSVFKPIFKNNITNIVIAGYEEVTNLIILNRPWRDLSLNTEVVNPHDNIYGIPLIIGAKKGIPNFNELALQTDVQVTRKIELRKRTVTQRPYQTNLMYIVGISNLIGVESWNPYTNAFPRALELRVTNRVVMLLTNSLGHVLRSNYWIVSTNMNISANQWQGKEFRVPLMTNLVFITNSIYISQAPYFLESTNLPVFANAVDFISPTNFVYLVMKTRLVYILIDRTCNRILDFVNIDNIPTVMNVSQELIGNAQIQSDTMERLLWDPVQGITNQIEISLGNISLSDWRSYSQNVETGKDKERSIDVFRVFCGLSPLSYSESDVWQDVRSSLVRQTPFNPTRRVVQMVSIQVNDPLVHYTMQDLIDPRQSNVVLAIKPPLSPPPTNNLGKLNPRYRPWGGNPNQDTAADVVAFNLAFKDPLVFSPDDWNFPTNKFPTLGWIGRVHRGTPWQTVYLKSAVAPIRDWTLWAGNAYTHPTNDWKFLELFTVRIRPEHYKGQLGVNQTNIAAWSAVLGGISVLSNTATILHSQEHTNYLYNEIIVEPGSPQVHSIVSGIIRTKEKMPGGVFKYMGELFATPELSELSPYLDVGPKTVGSILSEQRKYGIADYAYERIPEQILSLIREDVPYIVVYAFGQSLAPSQDSIILSGPYRGLCTNYVITGEAAAKAIVKISGSVNEPKVEIENFNYIPLE